MPHSSICSLAYVDVGRHVGSGEFYLEIDSAERSRLVHLQLRVLLHRLLYHLLNVRQFWSVFLVVKLRIDFFEFYFGFLEEQPIEFTALPLDHLLLVLLALLGMSLGHVAAEALHFVERAQADLACESLLIFSSIILTQLFVETDLVLLLLFHLSQDRENLLIGRLSLDHRSSLRVQVRTKTLRRRLMESVRALFLVLLLQINLLHVITILHDRNLI